ncbi:membrane protein insertion efficiency factor YidD [Anabaena sp. UHCC 0451]|uniref:membrane protein insertion efficiency factor YidD n=1 Tax=Anabaena sp. UHCC 0451 TaxID=2055235 RepID=UPI002B1EBD53|nr:membrane protein insertion efficiency factor YidD [Anabaena sp. UHCC 0451]MEA5577752.1 membrane protein insertion efficiency factor YidD [Anabaena sp. UHCC 0451]
MQVSLLDLVTREVTVSAITGYQKHISPHKGFACAHRVLYGGESCSQYIKRVIGQEGLKAAFLKSRVRFQSCKQANLILRSQAEELEPPNQTDEEKRNQPTQPITPKSSCQDSFDVVDLGINCAEISCDCPEMLNMTPDCSSLDCSALDCSALDCSILDCGGCSW